MQKDRIPPRPDKACFACGSDTWYLRVAYGHPEWICGKCHPKPDNDCPGKVGPGEKTKGTFLAPEELPAPVLRKKL